MGHTLLMGRTTYESIGRAAARPHHDRAHPRPVWSADGVLVAHSLDDALRPGGALPGEVMVAGGAQVYAAALPLRRPSRSSREVHARRPRATCSTRTFDDRRVDRGGARARPGLRPGPLGPAARLLSPAPTLARLVRGWGLVPNPNLRRSTAAVPAHWPTHRRVAAGGAGRTAGR